MKRTRPPLCGILAILIPLVLVMSTPAYAGGLVMPPHGWDPTGWPDPASDHHNHNHNDKVNIENIFDPTNHMYDAYGSWFNDGTGFKFHWTYNPPGTNDPDYIGHGFVPSPISILWKYDPTFLDQAPAPAKGLLGSAFQMWQDEILGTRGYRNPKCMIGFSWREGSYAEMRDINVRWLRRGQAPGEPFTDQPDGKGSYNGWWDPGEPFTDQPDENNVSNGLYDSYTQAPAWVTPADSPTLTFVEGYYKESNWVATNYYFGNDTPPGMPDNTFDFFTTSLHELGHSIGLDDLYNLDSGYSGFPASIMGTAWTNGVRNPYKRQIDLGSLQGAIDLYSIPIPEPVTVAAVLVALGALARYLRKRLGAS